MEPGPGSDQAVDPVDPAPRRTVRLLVLGVVIVVLAVIGGVLVLGGDDEDRPQPTSTSTTSSAPTSGAVPSSTVTTPVAPTVSVTPPPPTTSPPPTQPSSEPIVIWQGSTSERVVSLTFDAGSDLGSTDRILALLDDEGITATFGITGAFADQNPEAVRRIAAAGHQLVNHSATHPSFTGFSTGEEPLSASARAEQLRRAEASITAATGGVGTDGWFRPPYGDLDDTVERDVAAAGWPTILMWTVDSLGWQGLPADEVAARCLDRAEPGAIYLLHVGAASTDADALQAIVDGLRAAGYRFAPADELPR